MRYRVLQPFADLVQTLRPGRLGMRAVLLLIVAILTSHLFVGRAFAEGAGTCANYTERALNRAQKVRALKCFTKPFDDAAIPRWSTDRNVHTRWCRGLTNSESLRYEENHRDQFISNCAGCKAYANAAEKAARENVAFRCGFEGPRWAFGNDGHYEWCMQGTLDYLPGGAGYRGSGGNIKETPGAEVGASENAARVASLKACKATVDLRFSEEERKFCARYAGLAAAYAVVNMSYKCGAKQVLRWSTNEREHYLACLSLGEAGKPFLENEQEIRNRGAEVCREKGWKLSDDGSEFFKPMGRKKPNTANTKNIEQKMLPSGGDNTSTNPSKASNTKSTSSGGGCAGSAMDRLGGGCGPSGGTASGGENLVRDGGTLGSKGRPAASGGSGAAPATPPTANTMSGGGTEKRFGRSTGGKSGGGSVSDSGFYAPPSPRPVK